MYVYMLIFDGLEVSVMLQRLFKRECTFLFDGGISKFVLKFLQSCL